MRKHEIFLVALIIFSGSACSTSSTSLENRDYQPTGEEMRAFGGTVVPDALARYNVYDLSFTTPVGIEDSIAYLSAAVNWKGGTIVEQTEAGGIDTKQKEDNESCGGGSCATTTTAYSPFLTSTRMFASCTV